MCIGRVLKSSVPRRGNVPRDVQLHGSTSCYTITTFDSVVFLIREHNLVVRFFSGHLGLPLPNTSLLLRQLLALFPTERGHLLRIESYNLGLLHERDEPSAVYEHGRGQEGRSAAA
eukprot:scaffold69032_cov37-Tisochrysis_lutea.AAC.2